MKNHLTLFARSGMIAHLLAGLAGVAAVPAAAIAAQPAAALRDSPAPSAPLPQPSYADLVSLIEAAPLVLTVEPRKVAQVEAARAGDLRAGWARLYVEAAAPIVLRGALPPAAKLSYLADVPLDSRGRLPPLAGHRLLLAARPVAGHPDMVQLISPRAQLLWDAALETRVHAVLAELAAPDAPPVVTGVREAIHVAGTLAGEGETQIFLTTGNGSPAAISIIHQPGRPAGWSVSFSEIVDASGQPPGPETLAWYRLACFLPTALPEGSNVSATAQDMAQAADDYRLVIAELGPCRRSRR